EVDAAVGSPHRKRVLAVVASDFGEGQRLEGADVDVLGLAALVALPVVELEAHLLEGDPASARLVADPGRGLEGHHLRDPALGGEHDDARPDRGIAIEAVGQRSVRRPHGRGDGARERERSDDQAAGERHHLDSSGQTRNDRRSYAFLWALATVTSSPLEAAPRAYAIILPPDMMLAGGERLGPYEIVGVLGVG